MVVVLSAIVFANQVGRPQLLYRSSFGGWTDNPQFGWPWPGIARVTHYYEEIDAPGSSRIDGQWIDWYPFGALGNLVVALVMIVGTAAVAERLRERRWRQFTIGGLLMATWTAAALLFLYKCRDPIFAAGVESPPLGGFLGVLPALPWYVGAALILGLACTLQMAGWLVVRLAGAAARLRRRLPGATEASSGLPS
jgi:hypothetical protein